MDIWEGEPLPEEWDKIYLTLGRAISDWGKVEIALSCIFNACLDIGGAPAAYAFLEPRSVTTRKKMADRAVYVALLRLDDRTEISSQWSAISDEFDKANSKRNQLAHGMVVCDKKLGEKSFNLRFEPYRGTAMKDTLVRQFLASKKERTAFLSDQTSYTSRELHILAVEFHSLETKMMEFSHTLIAKLRA